MEHAQLVGRFLERFGEHVHALELNGLRPWRENRRVMWLAEYSGHVLVSGGDRHGLEPNANINLTNTQTFAEFVAELREDGISDILFMPQYREPLRLRMIETMCDIVRDYPDLTATAADAGAIACITKTTTESVKPLAAFWQGDEPWPVKCFLGATARRHQPADARGSACRTRRPAGGPGMTATGARVSRSSPIRFTK